MKWLVEPRTIQTGASACGLIYGLMCPDLCLVNGCGFCLYYVYAA